jgi:phosphoglycerate dehydrogenase-like enzyme
VDKFRVALSGDFIKDDGSPAFPSIDLGPLRAQPNLEFTYLDEGYQKFDTGEDAVLRPGDLANYDAVIMYSQRFTTASARAGGRLALVARFGVGYDTVDTRACTEAGIALTITPTAVRRPMAASLLALILAVTGKLLIKDGMTRRGPAGWAEQIDHMGFGLEGRTLGMIGVGNIGAEAVRLIKPLDMHIVAHDPYVDPAKLVALGVRPAGLEEVFRTADVLAVCCMLNEQTRHLVNAERLALMKPTAYLVNIARGPIVDQDALVAALKAGRLAGAGLDVLEREPPLPDEPIFDVDNVIFSAHALGSTDQCMAACFAESVRAVLDVMHGRDPQNVVNRDVLNHSEWRRKLASYRQRFGA